jgi:ribosomal protein S18 acetylase RimI-like enzyme
MAPEGMAWRPAEEADLPAILAIAAALHADHPERPEVFAERLRLAPPGFCRVLARPGGSPASGLSGYALTHPWRAAHPPALDTLLGRLPAAPDAWHIHDVALLPEARGRGLADAVLREIEATAAAAGAGLRRATLVAVAGKAGHWRRRGFRAVAPGDGGATLATYGAGAAFMARDLARR